MSKPILIVRFPHDTDMQQLEDTSEVLSNKGIQLDYHILIVKDFSVNDGLKFECLNAPHTEIEFNELKERVMNMLKQNK